MHRYRHSHSRNDVWDCPECVDQGEPSATVMHYNHAIPNQSNEAPTSHFTFKSSPQVDGVSPTERFQAPKGIITATTSEIPGYCIEKCMGTIIGMGARSRGFVPALGAVFKTIPGGDIRALTKLMYSTRNDAVARLCAECQMMGGNAVVGMRFETGHFGEGISQVCVYGTAVYIVKANAAGKDEKSQQYG